MWAIVSRYVCVYVEHCMYVCMNVCMDVCMTVCMYVWNYLMCVMDESISSATRLDIE